MNSGLKLGLKLIAMGLVILLAIPFMMVVGIAFGGAMSALFESGWGNVVLVAVGLAVVWVVWHERVMEREEGSEPGPASTKHPAAPWPRYGHHQAKK